MSDLVFFNGTILTMDEGRPIAEAMAVHGEQVSALGTQEEVRALASRERFAVNLHGKTVVLAFGDSHSHLVEAGEYLARREQSGSTFREAVEASETPFCPRIPEEPGSRRRDRERVLAALGRIVPAYLEAGITSVQDNTWYPELYSLFQEEIDELSVTCQANGMEPSSLREMLLRPAENENIAIGPVTFFIDGLLGHRTAWLWEPYMNDGRNCGSGLPARAIRRLVEPFVAKHRQVAVAAIGDRAISELCDALESLQREYPWLPELRIRIEHTQLIREEDYPRIRRLGLVIIAQPSASADFQRDLLLLGEERALRAYPHRRILEEEIPLAFGSDFPFEKGYCPLEAIGILSSRISPERIGPEAALRAYSFGSAYSEFAENRKGSLLPGHDADFLILDHDPRDAGTGRTLPRVEMTYRCGHCEFKKRGLVS